MTKLSIICKAIKMITSEGIFRFCAPVHCSACFADLYELLEIFQFHNAMFRLLVRNLSEKVINRNIVYNQQELCQDQSYWDFDKFLVEVENEIGILTSIDWRHYREIFFFEVRKTYQSCRMTKHGENVYGRLLHKWKMEIHTGVNSWFHSLLLPCSLSPPPPPPPSLTPTHHPRSQDKSIFI